MNETLLNQFYSFLIFIGIGILIVLIFDIFRILRKSFKTSDSITFIQDILFWIITGFILLYSIMKFNNGELRLYIFLGIIIGIIFYLLTISNFFIKTSVTIITVIKKVVKIVVNIMIFPFKIIAKFIRKIFFKPISFFFINFSKNITKIGEKIKSITRKNKVKKGF